ncbi:thermonuclease family protein [Mycetocola sp. 2940]|uniref:thermonuclease family protein n=1 Tax=Mycetocola sp. 2940 TaxID=3156452 RepID=UPI00339834B3
MLRRLKLILIAGVLAIAALLVCTWLDVPIHGIPAPSQAPPVEPGVLPAGLPTAPSASAQTATVVRVVDGDTLVVDRGNGDERVRLVGVDTPETVAPNAPVECFGPEASAYLTGLLAGRTVSLDPDPSQADTDRYGRLLRYVWVADAGTWNSVEVLLLSGGFAEPYRDSHSRKAGFDALGVEAQTGGRGLWSACA